ncbi:conserved hypothetical protein [Frankia sp. Hr75.2]|nr:conserved hypothetical protein [Frankia sp. Hr75.2]
MREPGQEPDTTRTGPDATVTPRTASTVDHLVVLLRRLYRTGFRHPASLLHSAEADDTIRLVTGRTPPPPHDDIARLQHLTAAHEITRAAAVALGDPETTVVFHLLDLHEGPARTRGGIETRREAAARAYSTNPTQPMSGPSFLRRTERAITVLLAAEILKHANAQIPPQTPRSSDHPEGTHRSLTPAPNAPPPPVDAFRPRRPGR